MYIHDGVLLGNKKKKRRKSLPFVKTWMDLEDIMLSEISQTEKDKYHIISLTC